MTRAKVSHTTPSGEVTAVTEQHLQEVLGDAGRYLKGGSLDRALEAFAEAASSGDPPTVAAALVGMANAHRVRCDWGLALDCARRSQGVARAAGLAAPLAEALNAEAGVHQSRGDFDAASALLRELLAVGGDPRLRGVALQNLGGIAARRGHLDEADELFQASHEEFVRAGYRTGEVFVLNNRGRLALDRGSYEQAAELLGKAIGVARVVGDLELEALATLNFAAAKAALGDIDTGELLAGAALGFFTATRNRWRQIECVRLLGDMQRRQGKVGTARSLYERGMALATEVGTAVELDELRALRDATGDIEDSVP